MTSLWRMMGNNIPLMRGARGLRGTTLVLPAPCDAGLRDSNRACMCILGCVTAVQRRMGVLEAANGASSGALYCGNEAMPACRFDALLVRSMPVGRGGAEFSAATALCRRLCATDSPHTRSPGREAAAPQTRNRPLRMKWRGRQQARRARGISVPLISRNTCSAGVCTLPAAMRVGCQASSGRFPSATLDESERDYSVVGRL